MITSFDAFEVQGSTNDLDLNVSVRCNRQELDIDVFCFTSGKFPAWQTLSWTFVTRLVLLRPHNRGVSLDFVSSRLEVPTQLLSR